MEELLIKRDNENVVISLFGKVDSVYSANHTEEIINAVTPEDSLVIDLEGVDYISSAGLRIILRCAKSTKKFEVINASEQVYEVFQMSGFTEIIKIKRAKRILSIEGKQVIGQGANGKVYRYDLDTIIKVYKEDYNMNDIENEIAMSKKAFMSGIPTAIPFDIVKIKEGGFGCVYEMLKSETMSSLMSKNPEKTAYFTELYAKTLNTFMHTHSIDDALPKKIDYAYDWCDFFDNSNTFSPEVNAKIRKLIDTIPDSDILVHGDFHMQNVMFQNDEPIIIDMDTLGIGHPLFEITFVYYSLILFDMARPEKTLEFFGLPYEVCKKIYHDTFELVFKDKSEEEKKDIQSKIEMLANIRMSYRCFKYLPYDYEKAEYSIKYVNDNIDKVTTLECNIWGYWNDQRRLFKRIWKI